MISVRGLYSRCNMKIVYNKVYSQYLRREGSTGILWGKIFFCNLEVAKKKQKMWGNWVKLCCASYVLSQVEFFLEQEEWLSEAAKRAGLHAIFHQKYHCESNYIKMVW